MSFSTFGLDPRLQKSVAALGFTQPTPIQFATIPAALTGQDILGSAETGTGKTAAYLLPLMQRLLAAPARGHALRVLVLVPTRELALQVTEQAEQLSASTDLRVVAIFGGVPMGAQTTALRRGVDIVVATPGRLLDHAMRKNIAFASLHALVLDEADRMLDVGFLPDIRRIIAQLPRERQTMLFSATLVPEVVSLAAQVTRNPARIQVEQTATPEAIVQTLFPVPEHLKAQVLQRLLREEAMDILKDLKSMNKEDYKAMNDAIEGQKGEADKIKAKGQDLSSSAYQSCLQRDQGIGNQIACQDCKNIYRSILSIF